MSKEMSTREAVEILNNFKNEDYNCKYTLVEVKQAIGKNSSIYRRTRRNKL